MKSLTGRKLSPVEQPTARVSVALRDGRTLHGTTTVVRGDAVAPLESHEVVEKFVGLASPVLGERRAREAAAAAQAADTLKNVRDLTAIMTPA